MNLLDAVVLFLGAMMAGLLNSVAGGGSFFSFPALLFTGVRPIPANATSTVAIWPGSAAAIGAYWSKLPRRAAIMAPLIASSVVGGLLGALILLRTPQATFMHLVPYLFLVATLLFTFGNRLSRRGNTSDHESAPAPILQELEPDAKSGRDARAPRQSETPSHLPIIGAALVQFVIALYGGFFGGGIGILMLAMLSIVRVGDIHTMNALKSLLAAAINGAAVVTFIVAGAVVWPQALLMIAGAVLGGYGGAHFAQKLKPALVRGFVIVVGFSMTAYFLWKY